LGSVDLLTLTFIFELFEMAGVCSPF